MTEQLPAIIENRNDVIDYRRSSDAASICRDIVVATATTINTRAYVTCEGWQAIAIAHGCAAGVRSVDRIEGGVRAIGELRRMSDGIVIAIAEGFVGEDEPPWYGGDTGRTVLPKRADYAIRAMAQTRAISRVCRSAFAHVVVMMKADLATTPAEEVPYGGFDDKPADAPRQQRREPEAKANAASAKADTVAEPPEGWGDFTRAKIVEIARTKDTDALDVLLDSVRGIVGPLKAHDAEMFKSLDKAFRDRRAIFAGDLPA